MQPIVVRAVEKGYEIIDGNRRVEAIKRLGRGQITALVKDVSDRDAQIMHVIGNLQRKNLKPIEQALTYQKMLDSGVFKDKRELSRAISKDEIAMREFSHQPKMILWRIPACIGQACDL